MPTILDFDRGSESRTPPPQDTRSGRFRSFPLDYGYPSTPNPNPKHASKQSRVHGTILGSINNSQRGPYGSVPVTNSSRGGARGEGTTGGGSGRIGTGTGTAVGLGADPDVWEDEYGEECFDDDAEREDERWWWERWILSPRRRIVRLIVGSWWRRVGVLMVLPAVLTVVWCAIPFPTYPLDEPNTPPPSPSVNALPSTAATSPGPDLSLLLAILRKNVIGDLTSSATAAAPPSPMPGHGHALVRLNFYFFLFCYYGVYNLISLLWITKLFNLYSLNWWPSRLGFRVSYTSCWILSLIIAIPLYLNPHLIPFTSYNLTWILLMFCTMTWPLLVAVGVVVSERRGRGNAGRGWVMSETQALFSPGYTDGNILSIHHTPSQRGHSTRFPRGNSKLVTAKGISSNGRAYYYTHKPTIAAPQQPKTSLFDLPSSHLRFIWFLALLVLSLIAYLLGEAYSELYLRTLPHSNLSNILYVYLWVLTIHSLDFLTSYILSTYIVSSPLEWAFKLFFALTYQTFVRALYARLRNPGQFLVLQGVSAGGGIAWYLLTMWSGWYKLVSWFGGARDGGLAEYRRYVGRGLFIRGIAENVSMIAWLGWVVVLHYGPNKDVYPYFAFESGTGGWWPGYGDDGSSSGVSRAGGAWGEGDGGAEKMYTFELTFWMSLATWASEIVAAWVVRRLLWLIVRFDVEKEARRELVRFPELIGAAVVLGVHVGQNMLVGIVRVRFA